MSFLHRYSSWLALPVGAALSLAFAPFNWWPLAVLFPAFLFIAWQDEPPRRAARIGFWFYAGTFLAGTYWLYHSIYVIGKAPFAIVLLLMSGLVAIMGGYMALLGYVQARWLPKDGVLRYLVALPAGWTLIEWLRGWLASGFPWLSLGYAGIDTPLAGFAPIAGVYGLTLLFAVMAGALAGLVLSYLQPTAQSLQPRITYGAALLVPWLIAYPLWHREWTVRVDGPISVAIVQGSVPQEMKWTQSEHDATLKLYRDLTLPHLGARLIVWPESALPDWAESLTDYLGDLWRDARAHGSSLVIGQQHYDAETHSAYNSVLALADHAQWYNKRHLVPFGEYFPVPAWVRSWMRMMSLPNSDFSSGAADQPPLDAAGQKIGVTICYEDAYGSAQLEVLDRATVLVNVTNDAWFGHSTARHQHLEIARMRALEAGRPLLRAANDGISGIIDAEGRVVSRLPSFESKVLTGSVQPRTGLTPYARVGNWLAIGIATLMTAAALLSNRMQSNRVLISRNAKNNLPT